LDEAEMRKQILRELSHGPKDVQSLFLRITLGESDVAMTSAMARVLGELERTGQIVKVEAGRGRHEYQLARAPS
jgi:hypothetical protein